MLNRKTTRVVALAALCCATVASHAEPAKKPKVVPAPKVQVENAYFDGRLVSFRASEVKNAKALVVGPWDLGPRVTPGPSDKRPNFYFVTPGTQHRFDGHPEFDHNLVISAVTNGESSFDVFWVVVLDPTLDADLTSEQQIIVATQGTFTPDADFTFDQLPSAGFLKTFLKINDFDGLDKFRHADGRLPKVAIITAKFTIKAATEEIEEPPTAVATDQATSK